MLSIMCPMHFDLVSAIQKVIDRTVTVTSKGYDDLVIIGSIHYSELGLISYGAGPLVDWFL